MTKTSSLLTYKLRCQKTKTKKKKKLITRKEFLLIKRTTSLKETRLSKPSCCRTSRHMTTTYPHQLSHSYLAPSHNAHPLATGSYLRKLSPYDLHFHSRVGKPKTDQKPPSESGPKRKKRLRDLSFTH